MKIKKEWFKDDSSASFLAAIVIADTLGTMVAQPKPYGDYSWVYDTAREVREKFGMDISKRLSFANSVMFFEISRINNTLNQEWKENE